MYILAIPEIEAIIFNYLDQKFDWCKLKQVNKYYKNSINNILVSTESPKTEFINSCKDGHILHAKYLYYRHGPIDIHADSELVFRHSCKHGHLDIAKWLFKLSTKESNQIDIHAGDDYSFLWSCAEGHLDVAKWLFELSNTKSNKKIDLHMADDLIFIFACMFGRLDVAKWLIELDKTFESCNHQHHIFHICCTTGNLNVAKWLYELSKSGSGDIIINDVNVFRGSCINNQIDVVQWLFESNNNKLDISSEIKEIVDTCNGKGYLGMMEWLQENFDNLI